MRGLYDQMVRITIEPDWAKLLDFDTTIPKAVEDLVHAKMAQGDDDDPLPGEPERRYLLTQAARLRT